MKYNVKIYENNGGGIAAIVLDGDAVKNIITGFEDGSCVYAEFIAAAREGFWGADSYNPSDFSGLSIDEAAAEIEGEDALIAEITAQQIIIYPREMGIAGEVLFGLREEEND